MRTGSLTCRKNAGFSDWNGVGVAEYIYLFSSNHFVLLNSILWKDTNGWLRSHLQLPTPRTEFSAELRPSAWDTFLEMN